MANATAEDDATGATLTMYETRSGTSTDIPRFNPLPNQTSRAPLAVEGQPQQAARHMPPCADLDLVS